MMRPLLLALVLSGLLLGLLRVRGGGKPAANPRAVSPRPQRPSVSPARPQLAAPDARTVRLGHGVIATVAPRGRSGSGEPIEVDLSVADAAGRPLEGWGGAHVFLVAADGRAWHRGFREDGTVPGHYVTQVITEDAVAGPIEVRVLLAHSGNLAAPDSWTELTYAVD